MYNVEEGQESTGSTIKYVKPGINIVTLKSIIPGTRKVNGEETKVAIFTFENETGGTAEYVLFPFNPDAQFVQNKIGKEIKYNAKIKHFKTGAVLEIPKGKVLTDDEAKSVALDSYLNEIKHIRNRFDETIVITGKDFIDLAKNLATALKPFFGIKKIKLAAEKNGKFTNIKKYVPFLADLEDVKTLEALILKMESEEPTPDTETPPATTSSEVNDWPSGT